LQHPNSDGQEQSLLHEFGIKIIVILLHRVLSINGTYFHKNYSIQPLSVNLL